MGAFIRLASNYDMNVFETVFYRNAAALVCLLPWFFRAGGMKVIRTSRMKVYVLRAVLGLVAMCLWFYSLMKIPLADATALSFTAPFFTAVMAVFLFKEKLNKHRIIALFVGLAGVVIVLRPGTEMFQPEAMAAVVAAILWSGSGVMIKTLTATDRPRVVVFYMVLMMTPLSLLPAIPYLKMPDGYMLLIILALGFTSNLFQISLSNAFAATEVNVILPYDFMRLVFISVISYLAFGERLDIWTFAGGSIILFGAIYFSYLESRHRKKIQQSEQK